MPTLAAELTHEQVAFLLTTLDTLERQFADHHRYGPGLEDVAREHSQEMLGRIRDIRAALQGARPTGLTAPPP